MKISNANNIRDIPRKVTTFGEIPVGSYFFLDGGSPGVVWKKVSRTESGAVGTLNGNPLTGVGSSPGNHVSDDRTVRVLKTHVVVEEMLVIDGVEP